MVFSHLIVLIEPSSSVFTIHTARKANAAQCMSEALLLVPKDTSVHIEIIPLLSGLIVYSVLLHAPSLSWSKVWQFSVPIISAALQPTTICSIINIHTVILIFA